MQRELVGQKFGQLKVIKKLNKRVNNNIMWLCICDCGKTKETSTTLLVRNVIKSCGCYGMLPPGESAFNNVLRCYRNGAKRRGYKFSLTKEQFRKLVLQNCYYCDGPPANVAGRSFRCNGLFTYNGIDRINNNKSYRMSNVVTCCKVCNVAKKTMTMAQFIELCMKVAKNLKK